MLPAPLSHLVVHVATVLGESPGLLRVPPPGLMAAPDPTITHLLDRADGPSPLTALCLLDDPRHLARLQDARYGCVLCSAALRTPAAAMTAVVWQHPRPRAAMAVLLATLLPPAPCPSVSPLAWVHPDATVHPSAVVGAFVTIEAGAVVGARVRLGAGATLERDVRVGEDSDIGPRVVIAWGTVVGARCRVDAGAVLGAHGFGYLAPRAQGEVSQAMPHVGGVLLEDDVHVGALATVARGTLHPTVLHRGARLDAQVHVGHNGTVGAGAFLAGQAGLAGSVTVGAGALLGGQVGVADHVTVGAGARIAAASGVTGDVPAGAVYGGYPARPRARWLRATARMYRGEKP